MTACNPKPITPEQQELYAWRRIYGLEMLANNERKLSWGRMEIDHAPPATLKVDAVGNVTVILES